MAITDTDVEIVTNLGQWRHFELLCRCIAESDVSILCAGWIDLSGMSALSDCLDAALSRGAKITLYTNKKHTKRDVRMFIKSKPGLMHFIAGGERYLHTKVFYFENQERYTALIGSANLTIGALTENEELSVQFTGTKGDAFQEQVKAYLDFLPTRLEKWAECSPNRARSCTSRLEAS